MTPFSITLFTSRNFDHLTRLITSCVLIYSLARYTFLFRAARLIATHRRDTSHSLLIAFLERVNSSP